MTESTPTNRRARFPGISSRAWEHPADRSALVALRSLSGFDSILKSLAGLFRERRHRLIYLASSVRVDRRQFSDVDDLYLDALHTLDAPERYELYVRNDPVPHAMCLGMDTPFIVVSTGMIDLMEPEELRYILGHEVGHALSGHAVYQTMMTHLLRLAGNFGWLPVGGWGLRILVAALMEWSRKSELSADRAGLLVAQNETTALRAAMKIAGGAKLSSMDSDAFLEQAAEYESSGDLRDGVLKLLNLELETHPFAVTRAAELKAWAGSPDYAAIVSGDYPRRDDDQSTSVGQEFRSAAKSYKEKFDASTDPLISTLRGATGDLGGAASSVGQNIADTMSNIWDKLGLRGNRESNGRESNESNGRESNGRESSDPDAGERDAGSGGDSAGHD